MWTALPGPQTQAKDSLADEVFYGGSAGGGKSDLLLGLAATEHHRSIIFRREYPQTKALVDRSREIIDEHHGTFNGQSMTWRLKDGRQIEFGSVPHEDNKARYMGRPHDLIGFDELPQFSRVMYRFLIGWNRSTVPGQRVRVVGAGNPPLNPEDRWVIEEWGPWLDDEFEDPATPGELRWYTVVDEKLVWFRTGEAFVHKGELVVPRSRTFIPARLADNPYLEATGYRATLQAMPEPLRSKLLYGDMNAGMEEDPWQVIPAAWVREAQKRWTPEPPKDQPQSCIGVDVARGGKDKTVLVERRGPWFAKPRKYQGVETDDGPKVAALVLPLHEPQATVNVDVIGVGSSVYDCLKGAMGELAVAVNNAESSQMMDRSGKFRLVNVRAASYWKLREALDPLGPERLALPPDNELLADLCSAKWKVIASGIIVEPKEDIIKRIGRSPDVGDAVVLAHYIPPGKREFKWW